MNEKYKLYQQVVLAKELPHYHLQKGDVATLVEVIPHENKTGYCLEIFDNNGDTLNVIIVDETDIQEIMPRSVVNYRQLQKN